jgi:hypothetical protein
VLKLPQQQIQSRNEIRGRESTTTSQKKNYKTENYLSKPPPRTLRAPNPNPKPKFCVQSLQPKFFMCKASQAVFGFWGAREPVIFLGVFSMVCDWHSLAYVHKHGSQT